MNGLTGQILVSQLIRKLLQAKHKIWITRCKLIHDRAIGGLYIEQDRILQDAVNKEFDRGFDNITSEHLHLTMFSKQEVLSRSVDFVRSWLVDIYQSRGEFDKAKEQLTRDRNNLSRKGKDCTSEDILSGLRKRVCVGLSV